MTVRADLRRAPIRSLAGVSVALAGTGLVGVGLWARGEVKRALARERIAVGAPLTSARQARATAELIRTNTLEATGGRTYAEVAPYARADGSPTADKALAATDERTGQPLEHPEHELWIQSTALQSALMQAYLAARLSELTVAVGAAFVVVGGALVAAPPGRDR